MTNNGGELSPDMLIAIVCEKMSWTYQDYLSQPEQFIRMLIIKWEVEAEYAKIKEKDKN